MASVYEDGVGYNRHRVLARHALDRKRSHVTAARAFPYKALHVPSPHPSIHLHILIMDHSCRQDAG
jgi:hypothetical protein